MKPCSLASSHTGRRGQDVRHASMTSAYGRGFGPSHSSRSRIRASTTFDTEASLSGRRSGGSAQLSGRLAVKPGQPATHPTAIVIILISELFLKIAFLVEHDE